MSEITLSNLYTSMLKKLQAEYDLAEAEAILNWLIEDMLLIKKHQIAMLNRNLSEAEIHRFDLVIGRLLKHEPLQYILGYAPFLNFRLKVNASVLIPRPETEELALHAIDFLKALNHPNPQVLDVGTGSGCLAIAVKKNVYGASVTAIDVSEEALQVAADNALHLRADISFKHLDFLTDKTKLNSSLYHLIISNPPYVRVSEAEHMRANVLHYEPATALFVPDTDALVFYRELAQFGKTQLQPDGVIMAELNQYLAHDTLELFISQGYSRCELLKDTNGHDRLIKAAR
jgi:release factor glutamine methyltransferase